MVTTPEGRVKRAVSALLREYSPELYYDMPVPGGFGKSSLDYIGWINGHAFAVETKAPGKSLTARQKETKRVMELAGACVFVIDNTDGPDILALKEWIDRCKS